MNRSLVILPVCALLLLYACKNPSPQVVKTSETSVPADLKSGPEAREWLKENRNESALASNRFGRTESALEFVDQLYGTGAERVIVAQCWQLVALIVGSRLQRQRQAGSLSDICRTEVITGLVIGA